MKTKIYLLFPLLSLFFLITACDKTDNPEPDPNPGNGDTTVLYDHSLIIIKSDEGEYCLVNPVDGKDLYKVVSQTYQQHEIALGFMGKKALITSHSNNQTSILTLYTCDAETGNNLQAVTDETQLDVQRISSSPVAPQVVFSADQTDDKLICFQIFTMSEDGTGLTPLSFWKEGIDCPSTGNVSLELHDANFPAFSPDGNYIAFTAFLREIPPENRPHCAIMVMQSDGDKKQILHDEPDYEDIGYEDVCWTTDGKFIIFTMLEDKVNFHRLVKVLNVETQQLTDITSYFETDGIEVENISTSPVAEKIVFTQHLAGGSDLFVLEYETANGFKITGSPLKITDSEKSGHKYYEPYWQKWNEQQ